MGYLSSRVTASRLSAPEHPTRPALRAQWRRRLYDEAGSRVCPIVGRLRNRFSGRRQIRRDLSTTDSCRCPCAAWFLGARANQTEVELCGAQNEAVANRLPQLHHDVQRTIDLRVRQLHNSGSYGLAKHPHIASSTLGRPPRNESLRPENRPLERSCVRSLYWPGRLSPSRLVHPRILDIRWTRLRRCRCKLLFSLASPTGFEPVLPP